MSEDSRPSKPPKPPHRSLPPADMDDIAASIEAFDAANGGGVGWYLWIGAEAGHCSQ